MFRKKTLDEIGEELERENRKLGVARDYEDLSRHMSDNAYLYYIHHRVGWTNKLLGEIRTVLKVIAVALFLIGARLFGWL